MKLLRDWEGFRYYKPYHCARRGVYENRKYFVRHKAQITQSFFLCWWKYEITTDEHIFHGDLNSIIEKSGITFSLKSAKRKADKYLEKTGWRLLDKEPGLMVLL